MRYVMLFTLNYIKSRSIIIMYQYNLNITYTIIIMYVSARKNCLYATHIFQIKSECNLRCCDILQFE